MTEKIKVGIPVDGPGGYSIQNTLGDRPHSFRIIAAESEADAIAIAVETLKKLHHGEIELPDGSIVQGEMLAESAPAEESTPTE